MTKPFPLGKLPADVLAALLAAHPNTDPRVVVGPRLGEDAAVLDLGEQYLIAKTDPITFAAEEIGWYAVHVNANDIATTGAAPAWFMATLLLPEAKTDRALVTTIFEQIHSACTEIGVTLVGGHTEITHGIDRPIVVGTMLGLAAKDRLISTGGAQPGDVLLLTKGVPVEAIAIIARERRDDLVGQLSADMLDRCANFLHAPGISVARDAAVAIRAGRVHAMHDPTEGGIATGLWEMALASGRRLVVDLSDVVLPEGQTLCEATGINPLGAIASGALLMAVNLNDALTIQTTLAAEGIRAYHIGRIVEGEPGVIDVAGEALWYPDRDEIAKLFG